MDITPPVGVAHGGWGAQTHEVSIGNDMPLLVTAVVVSNGDVDLAIVDVDIGIFTGDQDRKIRDLISEGSGIPFTHIRLSYSHTHSGPITFGQWIKEGMVESNSKCMCKSSFISQEFSAISPYWIWSRKLSRKYKSSACTRWRRPVYRSKLGWFCRPRC